MSSNSGDCFNRIYIIIIVIATVALPILGGDLGYVAILIN